jgi:hypothetical protein
MNDWVTAYFMVFIYLLGMFDGMKIDDGKPNDLIRIAILLAWPVVLCRVFWVLSRKKGANK